MIYSFKRVAAATSVQPIVETSSDLVTWETVENEVDGVSISMAIDSTTGDEAWTVKVPTASSKMFIRMRADIP